jgi:hypothetical protein
MIKSLGQRFQDHVFSNNTVSIQGAAISALIDGTNNPIQSLSHS